VVRAGKPFRVEGCNRALLPKGHSVVIQGDSCGAPLSRHPGSIVARPFAPAIDAEVLVEDAPDFFAKAFSAEVDAGSA